MAAGGPFSRPLQEVARFGLPPVFVSCTKWLKQHALTEEGLFRKKADARLLLSVKRAFEDGRDPIAAGEVQCPHTVAGVLRLWLSCIPGHVVPGHLVELCCKAQLASCHVARLELLRSVLSKADTYVLELLYSLAEFLHHYRLNQRRAALPPPDLARVFSPLLLRLPLDASYDEKELAVAATEMLIADFRPIFTRPRCAAVGALDPSAPPPPSAVTGTAAAMATAAPAAGVGPPAAPGSPGAAGTGGGRLSPGKCHGQGVTSPRSSSPKSPASPSSRPRPGLLAPTSPLHGLPGNPGGAGGRCSSGGGGSPIACTGSCPSPPPPAARAVTPVRLLSAAQRAAAEAVEAGLVTPGRIGVDAVMGDCTWLQLRSADLPERSDDSEVSSDGSSYGGGRHGSASMAAADASGKVGHTFDDLLLLDGLSLSGDSEDGDAAEEGRVDCELLGMVSALLAGATTQLF